MGLMSKLSSMFTTKSSTKPSSAQPTAAWQPPAPAVPAARPAPKEPLAPKPHPIGVTPVGTSAGRGTPIHDAGSDISRGDSWDDGPAFSGAAPAVQHAATRPAPLVEVMPNALSGVAPQGKRSKQEMLEELERNYKEIVDVVRKVGANLEHERERAAKFMAIGENLLSAARAIPEAMGEHVDRLIEENRKLHEMEMGVLNQLLDAGREGVDVLKAPLAQIAEHSARATQSQDRLATSMAEFRQTLVDLAQAGVRSNVALEQMAVQSRAQQNEMHKVLEGGRKTVTWLIGAALLMGGVSLLIALVAMFR